MSEFIFENAEGAETRTNKLNVLAEKHNTSGVLCMKNTGGSMALTTTYKIVDVGGVVVIDESKNLFEYNKSSKQMKIKEAGYYLVSLHGSANVPTNTELSISLFRNGVQESSFDDVVVNGLGVFKPITAGILMMIELQEDDILDIRAKVDTPATVEFLGNNSIFEKRTY